MSDPVPQYKQASHTSCRVPHPFFENKTFLKVIAILEKISLCAMAIFAAYICPKLFFPFFGCGVILGAYLYWNTKDDHQHESDDNGGCSQGFVEQLTGVKLPPPIGLAANLAITVCHIEHHASVFAPLIGLNFGMWVGKFAGQSIPLYYNQFTAVDLSTSSDLIG